MSGWVIAYAATILALAYAVPKVLAVFFQMSLVNAQIETLTSNSNANQTEFDLSGTNVPGPYA